MIRRSWRASYWGISMSIAIGLSACSRWAPPQSQPSPSLAPQVLTVEGEAVIEDGAVLQARSRAVQTALQELAVQLDGKTSVSVLIGNAKVVDEWEQNGNYHVQVLTVASATDRCQSPYRKHILATAFPAVDLEQISANESQDLYSGIPREIGNLLMQSGDFIATNKTDIVLYQDPKLAPDGLPTNDYGESRLMGLAEQTHSQFVLSGVIRNFEVESTEYRRGAGLFAQVKSAFRDIAARRGITLDVYVHDGYTGALLFQHRYADTVVGDVWIPNSYSVGSERFRLTPAGSKIEEMIHAASQDIQRIFGCYPFSARVLKVNFDSLVISAGTRDKLQRGDHFIVYATDSNAQELGWGQSDKTPLGLLRIEHVAVNYAVGKLEKPLDIRKIRPGDWVKSW